MLRACLYLSNSLAPLLLYLTCGVWTAIASQAASAAEEQVRLLSITRARHAQARPGSWVVLQVKLGNLGDQTESVLLMAEVDGAREAASARRISLLPKQQSQFEVSLRVPDDMIGQELVGFTVGLYRESSSGTTLLTLDGKPMQVGMQLPIATDQNRVAMLIENPPEDQPYWRWPQAKKHMNYELILSGSVASRKNRSTISFNSDTVPLSFRDWTDMGIVVVSDPTALSDAAARASLKRFIQDGGRVWLMLDQLEQMDIQFLLASGQACMLLDEVELTDFSVQLGDNAQLYSIDSTEVSLEDPARLSRVYQQGGRISHFVEEWPAAIWFPVGKGEVLVTTLESHAWLEQGSESQDPILQTEFKTHLWAKPLVGDAFVGGPVNSVKESLEYPLEFIGSPVLPRRWVTWALGSFVVLLTCTGLVLFKRGNTSSMGFWAPALSLLVGTALCISSTMLRRDKVDTVASLQLVHLSPDGSVAQIQEQAAVYLNSERDMELRSSADGWAQADEAMQSGIQRFTFEEPFPGWALSNGAWPPGTWRYAAENFVESQNLLAVATVNSEGLEIRLPAETKLTDTIIGFEPGNFIIGEPQSDEILLGSTQLASGDRWIPGTLISDEQRRRIDVYKSVLRPNEQSPPLPRTLYGWSDAWDVARWTDDGLTRQGSALVALPIRLLTPAGGEPIFIPAGMVRLQQDMSRVGRTSSYSDATGVWQKDVSLGIDSYLQFKLPPEVLPFQAESVTISLDIKAPQRTVRLMSTGGEQEVELAELESPSIPWQTKITDPTVLNDARDGILEVRLTISDRNDVESSVGATSVVNWGIDSFRASFRGTRISEENP